MFCLDSTPARLIPTNTSDLLVGEMRKTTPDTPDEYLGVLDLADMLGVERQTVYNLNSRREGPPMYRPTGGKVRFRRSEVEEWIEASGDGSEANAGGS